MMKSLKFPIFLLLSALIISCSSGSYEKLPDGVVVSLTSSDDSAPQLVRVQVVTEDIFRVSATPESNLPNRNSLVVVPQQKETTPFTVTETGKTIEIAAEINKINALFNKSSRKRQRTKTKKG